MHAGHDLRRKSHPDQTSDAAKHACLSELLAAGTSDHVGNQELQGAGDETETGEGRCDCATSINEVANQTQKS